MKAPTAQEIIALETDYRHHYNRDIEFPHDYPTGVLLGCVDVVDVLSQDDYKHQFGGHRQDPMESQSPFVFICENPQELFIKFPIKGVRVRVCVCVWVCVCVCVCVCDCVYV